MSVAHLLTVLENDEFIERIQKRPEAFIGTTGLVGLENLLVQTINGLLEFFIEKNQGKIAIQLSRQQISFQVSSTRPLVFEQKQVDLEPPFLYLSVLQAFSKQVGISIDQEKQRTIFIYHQGQLKKRLLLPIEETQERIEVLFWPDTQIFGTESLSYMRVLQQCQQIAMLNPGLKILLTQEEEQKNLCY
ncbi:MAG: DNA topoisomerase II, partial [Enterococcaceae bacterium]|nr:DNA topoisomerase II [Enterococcaceae bacterium]